MYKFFLIFIILYHGASFAATDIYSFNLPEQQQRFQTLTSQLRCLVCQNQSLTESNAPLANDLRKLIAEKINLGFDNQQIINFLVVRYGNFILYQPPLDKTTYILWFGPFLLLLGGLTLLGYFIIRKNSQQNAVKIDLNSQQQKHLTNLLTENQA
ncbi:cytochrome c-type biogenesis protein CcmH [soil metagenome]